MPKKKITVAICYDFDGTLIRGNMQENSFIPEIDMKKENFWKGVKRRANKHDMDEVLSYMQLMIQKTHEEEKPFTRERLQEHGKKVDLFPAVDKWFGEITELGKRLGLVIQHYAISSGIDDMIRGSPIGTIAKCHFSTISQYSSH